jgi:predicted DNA-binding transcriptional regulator AlpA
MVMSDLDKILSAVAPAPLPELPRILGQLREAEATALARLCTTVAAPASSEQLLDVEEAAKRLNISTDYLYRHWRQLPFARKLPFGLRFSESGLNAYIRNSQK